ncbi:PepSY-associated TM helix domain-containing protein [Pontibacter sp. MBLB2868]|uniref:PepSY-associated TM helix domain-containing protein n=1 Tax=Pontibacter sp. MBLB2868 TaxID=3451555 RepID=UPI003F750220
MKKRIKRSFSIHHWCGLIAGIFILVISLSGSILVFDDQIDEATFARESTLESPAQKLQIDNSYEWVRQQNPGWEIRIPSLPATPHDALHYELRQGQKRRWIFVHPETGQEQATVAQAHNRFTYFLLNLHYNLLSDTPGKFAVLLVGIVLLLLTVTGFILYRRSIIKVLTFKQKISTKSRRSFYSGLHRVVGVWALVFNLLMCITGISLAITVVNSALKGSSTSSISTPAIPTSIDAALVTIKSTYPDFEVMYVRFPKNEEGKLQFLGHLKEDPSYYGRIYSSVQVNYRTGSIETADFLREKPWLDRLLTVLHPIHFGDYAGLFVQLLYCFFGLMPGILSISGFVIWYSRLNNFNADKKGQVAVARAIR